SDDEETRALVANLDDETVHIRIKAERAVNQRLEGSCHLPIAAYGVHDGHRLHLQAAVGRPDGSAMIRDEISGSVAQADTLGRTLAEQLLAAGADRILSDLNI